MEFTIAIQALSEKDQFNLYCYLKQSYQARKASFLDEPLEKHYAFLSPKAVALVQALGIQRVKELIFLGKLELSKHKLATRTIIDELETLLDCYGWELGR